MAKIQKYLEIILLKKYFHLSKTFSETQPIVILDSDILYKFVKLSKSPFTFLGISRQQRMG